MRTALTADMWDALNATWLGARDRARGDDVMDFLEWVRERSQLFSGAYGSTMLRNDAYYFTRLGTFIERADCTAHKPTAPSPMTTTVPPGTVPALTAP